MNGILEHVIDKILIWLDKIVQSIEHPDVLLFLFVESIEGHIVSINIHAA